MNIKSNSDLQLYPQHIQIYNFTTCYTICSMYYSKICLAVHVCSLISYPLSLSSRCFKNAKKYNFQVKGVQGEATKIKDFSSLKIISRFLAFEINNHFPFFLILEHYKWTLICHNNA